MHVFPILKTPATSLLKPFLMVIPVHQPRGSCIAHQTGLAIRLTNNIIHVSIPLSQIIPPSPSLTESKRLIYTSVSLLLSRIRGYRYHLSNFHIYVLVYCIWCFSFWLTSFSIIGSSFIHLIRTVFKCILFNG